MPINVTMPSTGPGSDGGTLTRWLVKEGDAVARGAVLAEIENEKATFEVEAAEDGVLQKIFVPEGTENVKAGQVLAVLARAGEERTASRQDTRRIRASPLARRLARQHGIDLAQIKGSGPAGRIVKCDIERAAAAAQRSSTVAPLSPSPSELAQPASPAPDTRTPAPSKGIAREAVPLTSMRKVIARRMSEAKASIPHFYLTIDIRMDPLLELRSQMNAVLDAKLSVNDWLIKALGVALTRVPDANVQFGEDKIWRFSQVDISVAVAVPGGLVTPVISDVARASLPQVGARMRDLVERARRGKLLPEEYRGGTAGLSNLGMYGVRQFAAIINAPQALMLAVGAAEKRVVPREDGTVGVATMMTATGSFDHRAIDGATGATLLSTLKQLIEQPLALVA